MSLSILTQDRAKPWLPIRCGALTCSSITAPTISVSSLSVAGPISATAATITGPVIGTAISGTTGAFSSNVSVSGTMLAANANVNNNLNVNGTTSSGTTVVASGSDPLTRYNNRTDYGYIEASGFTNTQIDLYSMRYQNINDIVYCHFQSFQLPSSNQTGSGQLYWYCPSDWTDYEVSGVGFYRDSGTGVRTTVAYYKAQGNSQGNIYPSGSTDFSTSGSDYEFSPVLLIGYRP